MKRCHVQISLPSRDGTKIITCPFFKKDVSWAIVPLLFAKHHDNLQHCYSSRETFRVLDAEQKVSGEGESLTSSGAAFGNSIG